MTQVPRPGPAAPETSHLVSSAPRRGEIPTNASEATAESLGSLTDSAGRAPRARRWPSPQPANYRSPDHAVVDDRASRGGAHRIGKRNGMANRLSRNGNTPGDRTFDFTVLRCGIGYLSLI